MSNPGIFDEGEVYDLMSNKADFAFDGDYDYDYVTFKCTKCGAQDRDRLYPGTRGVQVLNCWSCGAGSKQDLDRMVRDGIGMFPAETKDEIVH
jgi:hypothetical protein